MYTLNTPVGRFSIIGHGHQWVLFIGNEALGR